MRLDPSVLAMPPPRRLAASLWDALVVLAATGAAYAVPLIELPGFLGPDEAWGIEVALTAVFGADVVVRARRAAAAPPGKRIGAWFGVALDVVAALPFYLLLGPTRLEWLDLLKLYRVAGAMHEVGRHYLGQETRLRLAFFVYWLALAVHLITCGFIMLGGVVLPTAPERYVEALYWCMTTLTTVGYGDVVPQTQVQKLYAAGVMMLGVGIYAYLIGNIASLISNLDPVRANYQQQRERLSAFMQYQGLPRPIRRHVHEYFDYLWEKRLVVDEPAMLAALPPNLRDEVALYLKRDLVLNVPLFRRAGEAFVHDVALQMRPFVCLPGDFVVRAGEHGREMYFLSRGTVEVLGRDGAVLRTLHGGDFFGEIALFTDAPRTASVRAVSTSDLYVLDKAMFDRIVAFYPEVAALLEAESNQRRSGVAADGGQ
jgi:voltage-gated potassium channel